MFWGVRFGEANNYIFPSLLQGSTKLAIRVELRLSPRKKVASGWSSGESFTYCTVLDPSSKLLYIFAIYDNYIVAVEPRFAHERLDDFYICNNNLLQDLQYRLINFSRRLNCCLSP
jgi:hypothetical protein